MKDTPLRSTPTPRPVPTLDQATAGTFARIHASPRFTAAAAHAAFAHVKPGKQARPEDQPGGEG